MALSVAAPYTPNGVVESKHRLPPRDPATIRAPASRTTLNGPTTPMRYPRTFDVIVAGGGHAGAEAALAAVRGVVTGTGVRILEASR